MEKNNKKRNLNTKVLILFFFSFCFLPFCIFFTEYGRSMVTENRLKILILNNITIFLCSIFLVVFRVLLSKGIGSRVYFFCSIITFLALCSFVNIKTFFEANKVKNNINKRSLTDDLLALSKNHPKFNKLLKLREILKGKKIFFEKRNAGMLYYGYILNSRKIEIARKEDSKRARINIKKKSESEYHILKSPFNTKGRVFLSKEKKTNYIWFYLGKEIYII